MALTPRLALRVIHLDASVVHVERAFLARAEELEAIASRAPETHEVGPRAAEVFSLMANEFRALAEELHWR